jgi:hypothetical protein
MSWIDKELKKREATESRRLNAKSGQPGAAQAPDAGASMASLWERFEALNVALPEKLRLRRDVDRQEGFAPGALVFRAWLEASNGAGLGFTGEGIRYVWPQVGRRRSNNFWIRWDAEKGYQLSQRVGSPASGPLIRARAFNENAVDRMIECLVIGARIKSGSVCKRRWWWPF